MSIIGLRLALFLMSLPFIINNSFADDAEVVAGELQRQADGLFKISVEMEHSYDPPGDYLISWEVQTLSGDILAASHRNIGEPDDDDTTMDELVGIKIPQAVRQVKIFARCRRHGLSNEPLVVEVPKKQ